MVSKDAYKRIYVFLRAAYGSTVSVSFLQEYSPSIDQNFMYVAIFGRVFLLFNLGLFTYIFSSSIGIVYNTWYTRSVMHRVCVKIWVILFVLNVIEYTVYKAGIYPPGIVTFDVFSKMN